MMKTQHPPFDQWHEEETRVPVLVPAIDKTGTLTFKAGERVVKERVLYTPLVPHKTCADGRHFFAFVNGGTRDEGGRVLVQCTSCSLGKQFLVGIHTLIDGQLVERTLPSR